MPEKADDTTATGGPVLVLRWHGWPRAAGLLLYYLAILIALLLIYGRGDFSMPKFIYQGF